MGIEEGTTVAMGNKQQGERLLDAPVKLFGIVFYNSSGHSTTKSLSCETKSDL